MDGRVERVFAAVCGPVQQQAVSEAGVREFWRSYSLSGKAGGARRGYALSSLAVILIALLGLTIGLLSGELPHMVQNSFLAVYFTNLLLVLWLLVWVDSRLLKTILASADAFESDQEYYHMIGTFVVRIYEVLPWAPRPHGHRLHRPTTGLFIGISLVFVALPLTIAPAELLPVLTGGAQVPLLVIGYYVVLLLLAAWIVAINIWEIFVGIVFLGIRVQRLQLRLEAAALHEEPTIGLESFTAVFVVMHLWYFAILSLNGLLFLHSPTRLQILAYLLFAILPVAGFVGSQYGLHRAIVRSKRRRLQAIEEAYGEDLRAWFGHETPDAFDREDTIRAILVFKRELHAIPNWPINLQAISKVLFGSLVSLLSVATNVVQVLFGTVLPP